MPWIIADEATGEVLESLPYFNRNAIAAHFPYTGFPENTDGVSLIQNGKSLTWVQPEPEVPQPETAEQARLRGKFAIEAHIQQMALDYEFDSIITAGYRAGLPESPWHAMGKALALWADACWVASDALAEQVADEFQLGTRTTFPTNEEIISAMPDFTPPTN